MASELAKKNKMNECTVSVICTCKTNFYFSIFPVPMPSSWQPVHINTDISESVENHLREIIDNIDTFLDRG